ncbi:hypothetical protein MSG28_001877 [Choristoneura fumiferana]|uniref:Uncharacterized protein n=1 Tax=Choristoneura fumiferana TaxID=7141 RepID=A0ACC0JTB4_CHOFU|nr:hypothetical protein MSG28_001877 [Choristoneura fumiferana]
MSPLARSLLALTVVTLLHGACAGSLGEANLGCTTVSGVLEVKKTSFNGYPSLQISSGIHQFMKIPKMYIYRSTMKQPQRDMVNDE